jgi:cytochrome b pre-mRNA-processing protein 3
MRLIGRRWEQEGVALYVAAVVAARNRFFYTGLKVPDTLDGRFDMVCLHVILVIRRLNREPSLGVSVAQAVFDAMFGDMDLTLREMGVSDLSVGRKVREMWEAFHGRAAAYAAALDSGDSPALDSALIRNVWRGRSPPWGGPEALRRAIQNQDWYLGTQEFTKLASGWISFLHPQVLTDSLRAPVL